jgi:hypothetical protein
MKQYIYATVLNTQEQSNLHVNDGWLNRVQLKSGLAGGNTISVKGCTLNLKKITVTTLTTYVDHEGTDDFVREASPHVEVPTLETLRNNPITTQIDSVIDGKDNVTINDIQLFGHSGLTDRIRNYLSADMPLHGRNRFKNIDNEQMDVYNGAPMGNIDDNDLRDRNDHWNANKTTELHFSVPIPDGRFPMNMGYFSIYYIPGSNVVVKTVAQLLQAPVDDTMPAGTQVVHLDYLPYKFYRVYNNPTHYPDDPQDEWVCLQAPTTHLPNSHSTKGYFTWWNKGPKRRYDMLGVARSLDMMGNAIPTFVSCVATYIGEIQFGKSQSIGEFVEGASSFTNTRNEMMTMTPERVVCEHSKIDKVPLVLPL